MKGVSDLDAALDRPSATAAPASTGELVFEGMMVEGGRPARVTVRDGVTAEVAYLEEVASTTWIGPGWLDLQVNGFNGRDPNSADVVAEDVVEMVRSMGAHGIAGSCITICTESPERMLRSIRTVAEACDADPSTDASVVGIHVEGPHLSAEDGPRGVHPLVHIRAPDIDEYRRWQHAAGGRIRIVTLSPEHEGAIPYIQALVRDGVVVSIGHTAATSEQIRAAVDAGARWSTHLGNGSHAVLPRHANYVWDQLSEDRLSAGFIFDGYHLPPSVMKPLLRAKGPDRSILVSDAVAPAGLPPGTYRLFSGTAVELTPAGRLELVGSPYLAGSVAMLPIGVANAITHAGVTLEAAIRMVTTNPSRLLGLPDARGFERIRVGAAANLTLFRIVGDGAVEITTTVVGGRVTYERIAA